MNLYSMRDSTRIYAGKFGLYNKTLIKSLGDGTYKYSNYDYDMLWASDIKMTDGDEYLDLGEALELLVQETINYLRDKYSELDFFSLRKRIEEDFIRYGFSIVQERLDTSFKLGGTSIFTNEEWRVCLSEIWYINCFNNNISNFIENTEVLYLLQPNPKSAPRRFKVGFSGNLKNRLKSYKTVVPDFVLHMVWEGTKKQEKELLKYLVTNCSHVEREVFEAERPGEIIQKIEEFLFGTEQVTEI